jgi:hypothetical protein
MNPLLQIITRANSETVSAQDVAAFRQLMKAQPAWLLHPAPSGELPIELIRQKGIKRWEIALIRQMPSYLNQYSTPAFHQLLIDTISELSEAYWSAGWLGNIEYDLWELLQLPFEQWELFYQERALPEDIADLIWLQQVAGCWVQWDDEPYPVVVSLEEWLPRFETWRVQQEQKRREEIKPEYRNYQLELSEWESTITPDEKERINYLLKYGAPYRSVEEEQALRRLQYTEAYLEKLAAKGELTEHFGFGSPLTDTLAKLSPGDLIRRIADRIGHEHSRELFNHCPKCGKLARTPLARQCRYCNYDWH